MEQTLGKLHSGTTLNAWNQNPALRERRAASKQAQKPSTQGKHFVLSSKFNQAWTAGPIQGLFSLSQITQLAQPAAAWLDFKQSQKNSWFRGLPAAKKKFILWLKFHRVMKPGFQGASAASEQFWDSKAGVSFLPPIPAPPQQHFRTVPAQFCSFRLVLGAGTGVISQSQETEGGNCWA